MGSQEGGHPFRFTRRATRKRPLIPRKPNEIFSSLLLLLQVTGTLFSSHPGLLFTPVGCSRGTPSDRTVDLHFVKCKIVFFGSAGKLDRRTTAAFLQSLLDEKEPVILSFEDIPLDHLLGLAADIRPDPELSALETLVGIYGHTQGTPSAGLTTTPPITCSPHG